MKRPEGKAAVDKECEKLKRLPALDEKKVEPKAEVSREAKENGKTVPFANLDENAELAKHLQDYFARVVLRGGNVKDEEGYRAVFWTLFPNFLV